MKRSTGTAKKRGQGFAGSAQKNSNVEAMKPAHESAVKTETVRTDNCPEGRRRPAVRGLAASRRRSTNRLNAMAALQANTMASKIPASSIQPNAPLVYQANTALESANGNANSVWLKRIISNRRRIKNRTPTT